MSAGAIRLGIDPLLAARALSLIAGVASLCLLCRLGTILVGPGRLAGLPALMLGVAPEFAQWTMSGMETTWFLFMVLLAISTAIDDARARRAPIASAIAFAAAALTRPEAVGFFLASALLPLLGTGQPAPWRDRLKRAMYGVLVFGGIYGAYFLWHLSHYGHAFPNSYYAKLFPGGGARHIEGFLWYMAPVIALAAIAVVKRLRERSAASEPNWEMSFLVIVGFSLAAVWNINPLMAWNWRLFIPVYPMLFLLAARTLSALLVSRWRQRTSLALVLSLVLLAWSTHGNALSERIAHARSSASGIVNAHVSLGRWMRANLPEDTVLAVADSGAIPYLSRLRTIDIANFPLNNEPVWHGGIAYDAAIDGSPHVLVLAGNARGEFGGRSDLFPFLRDLSTRYTGAFRLAVGPDYHLYVFVVHDRAQSVLHRLSDAETRRQLPSLVD